MYKKFTYKKVNERNVARECITSSEKWATSL